MNSDAAKKRTVIPHWPAILLNICFAFALFAAPGAESRQSRRPGEFPGRQI
jgi:hypothetical protein